MQLVFFDTFTKSYFITEKPLVIDAFIYFRDITFHGAFEITKIFLDKFRLLHVEDARLEQLFRHKRLSFFRLSSPFKAFPRS